MWALLAIAASLVISAVGYSQARAFMRNRLRFVNAAQSGWAPLLAGVGSTLVAMPVFGLLPLLTAGTAIAFGVSVGLGVANGQRDIKNALPSSY
jgi:hypothetical protein